MSCTYKFEKRKLKIKSLTWAITQNRQRRARGFAVSQKSPVWASSALLQIPLLTCFSNDSVSP